MKTLGAIGVTLMFLFLLASAPAYSQGQGENKPAPQEEKDKVKQKDKKKIKRNGRMKGNVTRNRLANPTPPARKNNRNRTLTTVSSTRPT